MKRPFVQLPHDVAKSPQLTPIEFRVLTFLMCFNPCHPSYEKISEQTGLNRKTVTKALKGLKAKGVITTKRQGGYRSSNVYFIHPKWQWKEHTSRPLKGTKVGPQNGSVIRIKEISNYEDLKFDQLSSEELNQEIQKLTRESDTISTTLARLQEEYNSLESLNKSDKKVRKST